MHTYIHLNIHTYTLSVCAFHVCNFAIFIQKKILKTKKKTKTKHTLNLSKNGNCNSSVVQHWSNLLPDSLLCWNQQPQQFGNKLP